MKKTMVALMLLGALNLSHGIAQETGAKKSNVKPYPVFFNGLLGNPAIRPRFGNYAYGSVDFAEKQAGGNFTAQVSQNLNGLQITGTTDGSGTSVNLAFQEGDMMAGGKFPVAGGKPKIGVIWTFVEKENSKGQIGGDFDVGSKSGAIAAEFRQVVSPEWDMTVAGRTEFGGNGMKWGVCLQPAFENVRLSLGYGGDGRTSIAVQTVVTGSIFPEGGVSVSNGSIQSGWAGVTILL